MKKLEEYQGGENFDLREMLLKGRQLKLKDKTEYFTRFVNDLTETNQMHHMRCISSSADREVQVIDRYSGRKRKMIMFGSNNYLGLANHPYVKRKAAEAISEYGAGIGGPPLLNGYTILHRQLEERLAYLKGAEDVLIFSSGYGANVGLVSGLLNSNDIVVYDAYSHASFCDGIKMADAQSYRFPHNNILQLNQRLDQNGSDSNRDIFVGVEGVYSMDGDLAPLNKIVPLCKSKRAILILDDAHGTGVMGKTGKGTAEHFGMEGNVDITMGTFSKTFAATGGFVAASKPIINYLRFFARSYMFSASLPPVSIAIVLACLDVIDNEPGLLERLWNNIKYTASRLNEIGIDSESQSAIFPLRVPIGMDLRKAACKFHEKGIFVNSVEYPAVPISQQRFRISIMATHTKEDINKLIEAIDEIWYEFKSVSSNETKQINNAA
ncbi:MAG: pyridoxal phosphate-dependent aminotransferase family protein [Ignavibacteriaceae bacterium]